MTAPHTLPTGTTATDRFARELSLLLGPAHGHAPDGSHRLDDLRALGYALAYSWTRQRAAIAEAHPATAGELLAELEGEYGFVVDESLSDDERRLRLAAKARARFEGTPNAIAASVSALIESTTIYENTARQVAATDPGAVWRFGVKLGESWDDTDLRDRILRVVEQQKPAHTDVTWVRTLEGFLCDDDDSLTDRDSLDV